MLSGITLSAQIPFDEQYLDVIEKCLNFQRISKADSLMRQIQEIPSREFGKYNYRYHFVLGLLLCKQEKYEKSITELIISLEKMNEIKMWDCDNYLKTAYYLADSYVKIGKYNEANEIISDSFIRCIDSYETCNYSKKMYQLLLIIYEKLGYSSFITEQIHNELQKISINLYSIQNRNKDGEKIKKSFMYWYNYISETQLNARDSLLMCEGKGAYLYSIGEYDEAIRMFEKVKQILPPNDSTLKNINKSLLIMYASTANIDKVESLLTEIYDYGRINNIGFNPFVENNVVGISLERNGYNNLAQKYYERCDSFLNSNKNLIEWKGWKQNILSRMTYNCNSMGNYKKAISCCKEYEIITGELNEEERYFVYYEQGLALSSMQQYDNAIKVLLPLKNYLQSVGKECHEHYVNTNQVLGFCYAKINQNKKSIECNLKAIEIYKKIGMVSLPLLDGLYHNLGKAYLQEGKYKDAKLNLLEAARIQRSLWGLEREKTLNYLNECNKFSNYEK